MIGRNSARSLKRNLLLIFPAEPSRVEGWRRAKQSIWAAGCQKSLRSRWECVMPFDEGSDMQSQGQREGVAICLQLVCAPKASIHSVIRVDDKAKSSDPHFLPLQCPSGLQGWSYPSPLCLLPDPRAALKTKPHSCFNLRNGSDPGKFDSTFTGFQAGVKPLCSQKVVGGSQ